MARRDSVMKANMPGGVEGSYMGTEYRHLPPVTNFVTHHNAWCAETRGLWKMKNGEHMGGPFISLTRVDEMNMQIITIEGFVFAPGKDKRNPLRQLEAMLYSLILPHEVNEVVITAKKINIKNQNFFIKTTPYPQATFKQGAPKKTATLKSYQK